MGKVAKQTEAQKVNVNQERKSRGCGVKEIRLTPRDPASVKKKKKKNTCDKKLIVGGQLRS